MKNPELYPKNAPENPDFAFVFFTGHPVAFPGRP